MIRLGCDSQFSKGVSIEAADGTYTAQVDGSFTFNVNANGAMRRTRWIPVKPGSTVIFRCQIGGDVAPSIRLYTLNSALVESLVATKTTDSNSLKFSEVSYTVPVTSDSVMVGCAVYQYGGVSSARFARFFNPEIYVFDGRVPVASAIACGLVDMAGAALNTSFPSFGVATVENISNKIRVTLSQVFKSSELRPLVIASDGTASTTLNDYVLRCGDVTYTSGVVYFTLYYIDVSTQAIVAPPANSYASFQVLY